MGAFLKILVLVINWCSHLMTCCLINLMKSVCAQSLFFVTNLFYKKCDEPTTSECNVHSFNCLFKKEYGLRVSHFCTSLDSLVKKRVGQMLLTETTT